MIYAIYSLNNTSLFQPCEVGPLSRLYLAFSGTGLRRRYPDIDGSYEYLQQAVTDS
jgi:hypothetical protein